MELITQIADKNNISKKEVLACEKFFKINKPLLNSLEKDGKRRYNVQTKNLIKGFFIYDEIIKKQCKTKKWRKELKLNKEKLLKETFEQYLADYHRGYEHGYRSLNKAIKDTITDNINNALSEYVPAYHSHQEEELKFLKVIGEDTNRYFGLELESKGDLENACMIENYKYLFSPEEDGSLSQEGFELVSEPMTLKYLYKNKSKIDNMLKVLKNNKQTIDDDCGFHIHVSRKAFERGSLIRLVQIVSFFKEDIETFARREENVSYAKYFEYNPEFLWFKNSKSVKQYSQTRYQAVNFENKDTVEFRMFKGTLDTTEIYATIEFVNNLVDFTNNKSLDEFSFNDLLEGKNIKKYLANNRFKFKNKTIKLNKQKIERGIEVIEDLNNSNLNINISIDTKAKKIIVSKPNSFRFLEIDKNILIEHNFDKNLKKDVSHLTEDEFSEIVYNFA